VTVNSVIDTAAAGLRATQAGLGVVSQNVANAGSVGYTRRTLDTTEVVAGNVGSGVNIGDVQRTLDTLLQKQLRLETAGAAYTGAMADAGKALDAAFDQTSGSASLSSLVNKFSGSLQTLASDPSAYQNKAAVLAAASDMAGSLNGLSDTVQTMRQASENSLKTDVAASNDLLKQISKINGTIISSPANRNSAALLDQRDALIDKLSGYMDIAVTPRPGGAVQISTTGGLQLFDGTHAMELSFDARSPLLPEAAYSTDPSKRSVGTITATDAVGQTIDVIASGAIRSGSIAAEIELRDSVLPLAQTQLDSLAAGLATALSDKHVAGTTATPPSYELDLSDLQNGKAASLSYVDASGVPQTVNLVRVDDAASLSKVASTNGGLSIGIDFSASASPSTSTQISNALAGRGFTVAVSGKDVTVTGPAAGPGAVSAFTKAVPVTATQGGDAQLALFVDGGKPTASSVYTGSLNGTPQLTGFAGRITVNPAVKASPDLLVKYNTTTAAGDTTRPANLMAALGSTAQNFTAAAGIGAAQTGFTGSFAGFAEQVISFQAQASISSSSLNSGQQTVLSSVLDRYSGTAGVNIDTEMTQLIQLQTAYSANARIMTAAKDMLDMLLSTVQ
jgi:flagellar hook-associated protein 1 FlgK